MKKPYQRKLCSDSKTSKTRIIVRIENEAGYFAVIRSGFQVDNSNNVRPILPILPATDSQFATEQAAIAFADRLVTGYINGEQFKECSDIPDEEFGS